MNCLKHPQRPVNSVVPLQLKHSLLTTQTHPHTPSSSSLKHIPQYPQYSPLLCANPPHNPDQPDKFINLFAEQLSLTRPKASRQGHTSNTNLLLEKGQGGRIVRQSENVHGERGSVVVRGIPASKSAALLDRKQKIKGSALLSVQSEADDEVEQLNRKIEEMERENQKIREQNVQLRLMKLARSSHSMDLLAIKLESQELRRKIDKLKHQPTKTKPCLLQFHAHYPHYASTLKLSHPRLSTEPTTTSHNDRYPRQTDLPLKHTQYEPRFVNVNQSRHTSYALGRYSPGKAQATSNRMQRSLKQPYYGVEMGERRSGL